MRSTNGPVAWLERCEVMAQRVIKSQGAPSGHWDSCLVWWCCPDGVWWKFIWWLVILKRTEIWAVCMCADISYIVEWSETWDDPPVRNKNIGLILFYFSVSVSDFSFPWCMTDIKQDRSKPRRLNHLMRVNAWNPVLQKTWNGITSRVCRGLSYRCSLVGEILLSLLVATSFSLISFHLC